MVDWRGSKGGKGLLAEECWKDIEREGGDGWTAVEEGGGRWGILEAAASKAETVGGPGDEGGG